MKLGVIGGAGRLGSMAAFCVGLQNCLDEIRLYDVRENFAAANVMDMGQGFLPVSDTKVTLAKTYEDLADCDIIYSGASVPFGKDIKNREQELLINAGIIRPICESLKKVCGRDTILIVSANPVDVFVKMYQDYLGWEDNRILGLSGNDTVRFKWAVSELTGIAYKDLDAMVIGEHGDGAVRLYDRIYTHGRKIELSKEEQEKIERHCGDWFRQWTDLETGTTTGFTSGIVLSYMIRAIALDEKKLLPCSTPMCQRLGYEGAAFGLPVIVGRGGAESIDLSMISEETEKKLQAVAEKVRNMVLLAEKA